MLSRIQVHTSIPWIIQKTAKIIPAAITIDEDIYFSHRGSGGYDPDTIAGIKLIAHELTHTQQYKNYKTVVGFGWDYWDEYDKNKDKGMSDSDAYSNISFEVNARANADRVIQLVTQAYDNNQPCLILASYIGSFWQPDLAHLQKRQSHLAHLFDLPI